MRRKERYIYKKNLKRVRFKTLANFNCPCYETEKNDKYKYQEQRTHKKKKYISTHYIIFT